MANATLSAALSVGVLVAPIPYQGVSEANAAGGTRTLWVHFTHTGEEKKITFRRNGRYVQKGLRELEWIVRDFRRKKSTKMDPRLFDLIWSVYQESGATKAIRVVSGFRSLKTNNQLRRRSRGVAKTSQHTAGKAMDFFIPGVPVRRLREIGLRLQVGGVGYYPGSRTPFVHMDTGRVRHWPRMTPKQLAGVFPKGKTIHVSTNGRKLARYSQALAEYNANKNRVVQPLSKSKRTVIASASKKKKKNGGVLAGIFGKKKKTTQTAAKPIVVAAKVAKPSVPVNPPVPVKRVQASTPAPVLETTPAPTPEQKVPAAAPAVIANRLDPNDTTPIPSRIGRVDEAPKAPLALAAANVPAPRALPSGLRDQFTPPSAIVIAQAPAPKLRPDYAPTNLEVGQPQVIAANSARTEDDGPIAIDPTKTAALSRDSLNVPAPEVVKNRLGGANDPTRLVLNETPRKKPELVQPATATLAYAVATQPAARPSAISTDSFNDRFGSFDTDIRSGNLPPVKPAVEVKQVAKVKAAPKVKEEPKSEFNRFAAFDSVTPAAAVTLKDLGLGESSRALALRKSLGVPDTTELRKKLLQTQHANLTPPTPLPAPRRISTAKLESPVKPAESPAKLAESLTDTAAKLDFAGEHKQIVTALLAKESLLDEMYSQFALPKPNKMPSLFVSPSRTFKGAFTVASNKGFDAKFEGDVIAITPTVDFSVGTGLKVTWLQN
ncbi:MAG: DUF882 domain-containing protein [Hyphomicrobiales bacterium]